MSAASLIRRLPLMEGSVLDTMPASLEDWWSEPTDLLPVIAKPQLNQELEELVRFAASEEITLVPFGTGQGRCLGFDGRGPVLLVHPGATTVFGGVSGDDRTVWLPAGERLGEAEARLQEIGYTLSLWPEDHGSIGGNWVQPRGSFAIREYGMRACRRQGVQALLGNGTWLKSPTEPRSAAGPNIGRGMHGFGGAIGMVTQVLLTVTPLAEVRWGESPVRPQKDLVDQLRRLIVKRVWPDAVSVVPRERGWQLIWRQNLWSTWAETCWSEAVRTFDLEQLDEEPERSGISGPGRFLPWSELRAKGGKEAIRLAGPTAEGMTVWFGDQRDWPNEIPSHWSEWIGQANALHALAKAGAF